ncbi:fungal-specific transcription factor domain-containing protein [Calycina marina]|uniref:Fungal-specific transcription factor domain-containing protein n=1 Tax=Calycina marina TaxID=1763456 RepID=A0A9P7Z8D0_9HELO|nr:fungal-specific transcription factor domain-containing protein [Calycina marina]
MPFIHHFVTFCCRFLVYPNDSDGNPFHNELVPLAVSSPALLHAMSAVAAGHLNRSRCQQDVAAAKHYSIALHELKTALSNPTVARSDSTLGACLLLCVYEISHSENCRWLEHLQGARDLILFRGGPKTTDYLSRFFSLLDVSGSIFSGGGTLLEGNYWLADALGSPDSGKGAATAIPNFPAYDPTGNNSNHFHQLMVYMVKMSRLSADSLRPEMDQAQVRTKAVGVIKELNAWWTSCPPSIRDQRIDWRYQSRPQKLTVAETLEEEGISSIKSCYYGCLIYLHHILDPLALEPQRIEATQSIRGIIDIAKHTPKGYGLEMGLYFGLFMAGVAIFNSPQDEELLRRRLKTDTKVSIYHADRCLELLEVLWGRQHTYDMKYDWRQVQKQMGIQV